MDLDPAVLLEFRHDILSALAVTLTITALSFVIGIVGGVFIAVLRLGPWRIARAATTAAVEFTLSTPVPVHLFVVFYGIPSVAGWQTPPFWVIVGVLAWNQMVYMGEAYRGGIASVSQGVRDASSVLGLSRRQGFIYVVLPLAFRAILPILVSSTVNLIKDSALAGFIGVQDVMSLGNRITARTFRAIEAYSAVALIYFIVAYPIVRWADRLERQLAVAR